MSELVKNLKQEFADKDYRHSYAESFLNSVIATQIKVLREMRKWRQSDLAREAEMKQSVISRLENINYSSWSIKSLQKLAQAFDVVLTVRFERFKNLALDADRFGRKALEVVEFSKDQFFSGVQEAEILQTPASPELFLSTPAGSTKEEMVTPVELLVGAHTAKTQQFQLTVGY